MVKLLVKNRLAGLFGSMFSRGKKGSVKKASVGRKILFSLLYAYVAIVFLGLAIYTSVALGLFMIPLGAPRLYFAVFIMASLTITFVLSIFETKSELFECRDNELLLSMPIRPRDIVLSRVLVVLIYNYITEAIVMIPAIVVYGVIARDILGVLGGLLISLFVPLLSTALASAVGYSVAEISRRVRNSNIITIIISLAFMCLYFYGCFSMGYYSEEFSENMAAIDFAAIEAAMPAFYFIGSAALLSPLTTLSVVALSVGVAAAAYAVIARNYIRIITDNRGKKKILYTEKKLSQSGALFALAKKELARFFSSTTYMLNAGLGLVFEVVVGVLLFIKRTDIIMVGEALFGAVDPVVALLAAGMVLFSSMTMMSASALSLEGSSIWIAKTLPVTDRQLLWSKALPQIIVSAPPTLITSILLLIAVMPSPLCWPFVIIIPQVANLAFALVGINMNVLSHRFDFENEVLAIKSSLSVFLTMLVQIVTAILAMVGTLLLTFVSIWAALAALLGFFIILSAALILVLNGPAAKRYSRIEI